MAAILLFLGSLWGLAGVAMGALFDHALASYMSKSVETALRYHQVYAAVTTMLALFIKSQNNRHSFLRFPTCLFLAGSVIFSGSLYLASLSGMPAFNYGVPIGGVLLMAGWGSLAVAAFKKRP